MSSLVNKQLQRRYFAQGRGLGAGPDYLPWNQVDRNGRQSRGRGHLIFNPALGRLHHVRTDVQRRALMSILSNVPQDCRESFPLQPNSVEPEFLLHRDAAGSSAIADRLGLPHPRHPEGDPKVLTVDFLVSQRSSLVAIDICALGAHVRARPHGAIKADYWKARGVSYRLMPTPGGFRAGEDVWLTWAIDGLHSRLDSSGEAAVLEGIVRSSRQLSMIHRVSQCADELQLPVAVVVRALKWLVFTRRWAPGFGDLPDLSERWAGKAATAAYRDRFTLDRVLR